MKNEPVSAIFFDIGGVLTKAFQRGIVADFAGSIGVSGLELETYYYETNKAALGLGEITLVRFWEDVRSMGASGSDSELTQKWITAALPHRMVNQELLEIIARLRQRHIVGALTNLSWIRREVDLAQNLYSHFDLTLLSCEHRLRKPDPRFFELAKQQAESEASQMVVVDDKQRNADTANELGMHGLVFTGNEQLVVDLQALGVEIQ